MDKDTALKLALEALENSVDLVREDAYNAEKLYGNYPSRQGKVGGLKILADKHEEAITAIKQALAAQPAPVQEKWGLSAVMNPDYVAAQKEKAQQALDVMAENARELGLDYEPALKDNSNYRYDPPVAEPVKTGDTLFRQFMSEADKAGITHWPTPPAQPAVPDAIHHTDTSETLEYIQGWNDCRAETLKMRKP
jgi:tetratricopeptide (TPR) repeat protein